jgi:ABC-type nickel/cobalt efflux system permease component RcnA
MTLYTWMVWLHIFSALVYFSCHGVSMAAAYLIKKESNEEKLKPLLGLHTVIFIPMGYAALGLIGTALTMAALVNLWGKGWWLTSTSIFILITFWMVWYGRKYYSPIRKALGLEHMDGFMTHRPAETPNKVDLNEIQKLIAMTSPHLLMTVGVIAIGVLLWLMRFKPF